MFQMSLEELTQVKISGSTLFEQELKKVPSAATVFTREQIRRLGVTYVEELMNLVPGFQRFRSSSNSYAHPYSSRARRIAEGSGEILLLIDGVQIHEPRSGYNAAHFTNTPVLNVERVEFIRGPGSAIYGSNAMMGIVNIITTRYHNEVQFSSGNFGQRDGNWLASGEASEWVWNFSWHHHQDDGDQFHLRDAFTPVAIAVRDPQTIDDAVFKLNWRDTGFSVRRHRNASDDFYILSILANDFNKNRAQLTQYALTQQLTFGRMQSELTLHHNESDIRFNVQLFPAGAMAAISQPSSSDPFRTKAILLSREDSLHWHNQLPLERGRFTFGFEARRLDRKSVV